MQSEETLLIQFSLKGTVCYLSQQETLTMWRRCLARAGMAVSFSQGFNPHPKISLPLPRSVGVEGDQELLRVSLCRESRGIQQLTNLLNLQLPEGCSILKAERSEKKIGCQPLSILYVLSPRKSWWHQDSSSLLEQHRQAIQSTQSCIVFRYAPKYKMGRRVDIGAYFQNLEWDGKDVYVRCRFCPEGTVRVEEILARLGLNRSDLCGPVLRTQIEWQMQ
jgi:radical SAM-linked protein